MREALVQALARSGRTVAVAESFTGGRLLDALTDVPGASRVVVGGIVAYEDSVKRRDLSVRERSLRASGAVSERVALEMAQGVRRRLGADYAVATTGIAGPTGARPLKAIGLSIVAAAGPGRSLTDVVRHAGSRSQVKAAAVAQALELLARLLRSERML